MTKWKKLDQTLNKYLRLTTFPIAVKLLENEEDLSKIEFIKRPNKKLALCQIFSYSRCYGWTMGLTKDNNICPLAEIAMGFEQPYEWFTKGEFFLQRYNKTSEGAKKTSELIPRIAFGKISAIVSGALYRINYNPDFVLVYGNSAQIMRIIQGTLWQKGGRMTISTFGDAVCADIISKTYLTGQVQIAIPCLGDRRFGLAKDTDLIASIPVEAIDSLKEGLEGTHKAGSRIPIPQELCTPDFFVQIHDFIEEAKKM
ncbi:MAG: DUF169 domain-containing protein [Candidatus Thorarchaeota archaeon]